MFSTIAVADTKIISRHDFVAPLKELQNYILRIISVWSSFSSIRVCISPQFLPIPLQNYAFCVFFGSLSILYFSFDVITFTKIIF